MSAIKWSFWCSRVGYRWTQFANLPGPWRNMQSLTPARWPRSWLTTTRFGTMKCWKTCDELVVVDRLPQCLRDFTGDIVLDLQDVVQSPVVGFAPDHKSTVGAHQAGGHAHRRTGFAQAPIQDIGHAQGFCDIGNRDLLALVVKRRCGRRHPKAGNLAEPIDEFFGHSVGKIFLVHRLAGQV